MGVEVKGDILNERHNCFRDIRISIKYFPTWANTMSKYHIRFFCHYSLRNLFLLFKKKIIEKDLLLLSFIVVFFSFCPNQDENKKCMSHFSGWQSKVSDRLQKSCRWLKLPKLIFFINNHGLSLCLFLILMWKMCFVELFKWNKTQLNLLLNRVTYSRVSYFLSGQVWFCQHYSLLKQSSGN